MAGFDLSDYNTVAERLDEFKRLDPEKLGRIVTEIVTLPEAFATKFLAVKATVYRPGESEVAGTGLAWEQVPGKTPYTASSELMVCETSAVGRALVNALVADTKKGIASREEMRRAADKSSAERSGRAEPTRRESAAPIGSSGKSSLPPSGDETTDASPPLSATSTVGAGVRKGHGEGPGTPSASAHVHDWQPAPNPDAARRGFHVCKVCGISQKDPK